MDKPDVSVIIVFRNEAPHIGECLESVINQFDSVDSWELILVDSMSTDHSKQICESIAIKHGINFKYIINQGLTLSRGWNIGIRNATSRYLIRPDAHGKLLPGYISLGKEVLEHDPETVVAGGLLKTEAKTLTGKLIGEALSMRTGVGNSSFRTGEASGYKDTAVYGLYRSAVFEKVGLFDETLQRHQDTELHHRILRNGMRIYMHTGMQAVYFCRDSIASLLAQMYQIGFHFSGLIKAGAGSALRLRHRIPMMFYMMLTLLGLLSVIITDLLPLFIGIVSVYLLVILTEAFVRMIQKRSLYPMAAIIIIPMIHASYAAGTFAGIVHLLKTGSKQ